MFFEKIGKTTIKFVEESGRLGVLFWQVIRNIFKKPFELKNIILQMEEVGINSISVVTLTAISMGMVYALQLIITLEHRIQGSSLFIGGLVSVSVTRELGPILTALVVAGRIGSAFAAEIGTMKVTEQIDALETMATNPVKYLAVPRFIACMIMLPVLTVYADLIGIIGGFLVSNIQMGISSQRYFDTVKYYLGMEDIINGLAKTVVFGMIIALVGCNMGFKTSGGAEGVGKATTYAVVTSSILILIFDYVLTAILF